jgi:N-acetyltransferase
MEDVRNDAEFSCFDTKRKRKSRTYTSHAKRRFDSGGPARKRQCSWEHEELPSQMTALEGGFRHPTGEASSTMPSSPVRDLSSIIFSDPPGDITTTPPSSPPTRSSPETDTRLQYLGLIKKPRAARRSTVMALASIDGNCIRQPAIQGKKRMTQMQIDLGGDIRTTCKECSMNYIPSSGEDTLWHKRFHGMNLGGIDLNRRMIKALRSKKIRVETGSSSSTSGPFIAIIDAKSSSSERIKAKEVLNVVNTELSAAELEDKELWGPTGSIASSLPTTDTREKSTSGAMTTQASRFQLLLYIDGNKCTGLCLAERIIKAYKIEPSSPTQPTPLQPSKQTHLSSSVSVTNIEVPAVLGISRIWTSRQHRRKGIASALLQAAQCNFLFGMEISKSSVAFSQPTESGGALARAWYGHDDRWLVYREA